jgi:transcriptional regulator with PAS, ATPase and Fis domain
LRELKKAYALAQYDSPVLLLGETGVGKEVFARMIHRAGPRLAKPFVTVNCAAFTETLIESQLFGHRKGAFTGAERDHRGCFEEAHGGTLFLDEIGEMASSCQAKLLRALQYGKIQRLGDSRESDVNVRVVAATNVNLRGAIEERFFRQDLYFRFQTTIAIPPLRDRRSDTPKLAHHILDSWNAKHQKQRRLSQDAVILLMKHPWKGNVRELEGVIIRSAQLCTGKLIEAKDLLFDELFGSRFGDPLPEPHEGFDLNQFLATARGQLIERAIRISDGNRTKAAALLGITPQAVSQYLLKQNK